MIANKGNGFNAETGIFKAPVTGLYAFTFAGETIKAKETTKVSVYHNSALEISFMVKHTSELWGHTDPSWHMKLNKNDKIRLKVTQGGIIGSGIYRIYVTGILID